MEKEKIVLKAVRTSYLVLNRSYLVSGLLMFLPRMK